MGPSDFHWAFASLRVLPFGWHTPLGEDLVDLPGSCHLSFVRAMPLHPAGFSGDLAFIGLLLLPSRCADLSAPGCCLYEAERLHLRYGPHFALSTLRLCRYLHMRKTRS